MLDPQWLNLTISAPACMLFFLMVALWLIAAAVFSISGAIRQRRRGDD